MDEEDAFNEDTFILYNRALYFGDLKEIQTFVNIHGLKYVNLLLYTSILNDNKTDVEFLLKAGADANYTLCDEDTILHKAALHSSPGILELLLDYGADPWTTNDMDELPCFLADIGGCEENAKMLRDAMNLQNTTLLSKALHNK
jgi:ankyrin repeat protein